MSFYFMKKFSDFFNLRPSDLITTLADVLMDNFCPCFLFKSFKCIIHNVIHKFTFIYVNLYLCYNSILFTYQSNIYYFTLDGKIPRYEYSSLMGQERGRPIPQKHAKTSHHFNEKTR